MKQLLTTDYITLQTYSYPLIFVTLQLHVSITLKICVTDQAEGKKRIVFRIFFQMTIEKVLRACVLLYIKSNSVQPILAKRDSEIGQERSHGELCFPSSKCKLITLKVLTRQDDQVL